MEELDKAIYMVKDGLYKSRTGESINETVQKYTGLMGLAGFVILGAATGYVANEAMEYWAGDAPTAVRYAVDGASAVAMGMWAGRRMGRLGKQIGINRVRKVLDDKVEN